MPQESGAFEPAVIALTGGVASGKSAVGDIFRNRGALIIDADALAREAVTPGTPGLEHVVSEFGPQILLSSGGLDRQKLAEIIFSDPGARARLERIVHPLVRRLYAQKLLSAKQWACKEAIPVIAYVVPLLFEAGLPLEEFDGVVVVAADRSTCIRRAMQRDGCSEEFAARRFDAQLPIGEKAARADYVIYNNGTFEELAAQAAAVYDLIAAGPRRGKH